MSIIRQCEYRMPTDLNFFHPRWPVFYEDNHLLALFKPAGLLAQGDHTGAPSLLDLAKQPSADGPAAIADVGTGSGIIAGQGAVNRRQALEVLGVR